MTNSVKTACIFFLICIGISACATRNELVDRMMILPDGADVIKVKQNQTFIMATPIQSPNPAFPAGDFEIADSIMICARFVVTESGEVRDIQQIDEAPPCNPIDGDRSDVFMAAVRNALEQWSFFGAAVCEFTDSEDECADEQAVLTPRAIRLAYRFNFSAKNGRRQVSASRND